MQFAIKDEFIAAELSFMVRLYRIKPANRLNKLRHEMYSNSYIFG